MNKTKNIFLICITYISPLLCAKEPDVIYNNHNQLTLKQCFSGMNGVSLTAHRTQLDPLLPDEIIPEKTLSVSPHESCSFFRSITQPKIIIGAISITYITLMAKLLYAAYITIPKNDTWASWRQDIANSTLYKPEETVAKNLYTDIQAYYADKQDSAAFLTPIIHFVNDIDSQIAELDAFIKLHETLTYYKMAALFPTQEQSLAQAGMKIERLTLLKQFLIKSIRSYKISQ